MSINQGADRAPTPKTIRTPPWPAALAHFQAGRPVYLDPHAYGVDEPMDARCPGCVAQPLIHFTEGRPEAAGIIAIAIHHEDHCEHVRDLAAMAGRPR